MVCHNCHREIGNNAVCPYCRTRMLRDPLPHHLPAGTVIGGRYRIEGVLGEGGFGITYLGYNTKLDLPLAVKEYFPHGFSYRNTTGGSEVYVSSGDAKDFYEHGKERFLEEAKTLVKFNAQPGVVSVMDFVEENNTVYLVMEYLEGVTLQQYLKEHGRLSAFEAFTMLSPVMKTLQKIHTAGVIHRDISPDNIMRLSDGRLKLMDFGAAKEFVDDNRSMSVMLKKGYAPMEQYRRNGKQGPWTDVYALCATIYRCITGKAPEDALDRVVEDTVVRPSALGAQISPAAEAVLMDGLAIHQKDRIRDMTELSERWEQAKEIDGQIPAEEESVIEEEPVVEENPVVEEDPAAEAVSESGSAGSVDIPIPDAPADVNETIYADELPVDPNATMLADEIPADPNATMLADDEPIVPKPIIHADKTAGIQPAPKKKKTGVIAAAVIVILLLGAVLFFTLDDSEPEPMIAAGAYHTVGLKTDGTVVVTGADYTGQDDVDDWKDITAVSAGYYHTVGLKKDGTVVSTAVIDSISKHDEDFGQAQVSTWTDITAVSAGKYHTVGLKKDGTVVSTDIQSWYGRDELNSKADCGQNKVGSWNDIIAIDAGDYFTVGLKKDGTAAAVGSNRSGQCDVGTWTGIIAIAAGREHTVGLKEDGTVVAVGDDSEGQCSGVKGWRDIVAVAASGKHTVGLKKDGTVVAAGADWCGQCEVGEWKDIVAIAAGDYHTVGLKEDGTVVATAVSAVDDEDDIFATECNLGQSRVKKWKLK